MHEMTGCNLKYYFFPKKPNFSLKRLIDPNRKHKVNTSPTHIELIEIAPISIDIGLI